MERGRLVLEALVLLGGAVGAAMPISRSNKLGFCGATIGGQGKVNRSKNGSFS